MCSPVTFNVFCLFSGTLLDVPQFSLSLLFSDLPVELLGTVIVCKFLMLQVALY